MTRVYNPKQKGFTFIEIMIVITILAIIAAVALPTLSSTDYKKLDIAAQEIAQAIRFTRLESMRTGIPHGVFVDKDTDTVKAYSLESGTAVFNVYHPVDKKIYTLNIRSDANTKNIDLFDYNINFHSLSGNRQYLGFSNQGIPKYYSSGTDHMLNPNASITLQYAGQTRVISISPMVGRVTVQ
jgi:prepilin-type N-terminal cleavage/methylation domain-containing protein